MNGWVSRPSWRWRLTAGSLVLLTSVTIAGCSTSAPGGPAESSFESDLTPERLTNAACIVEAARALGLDRRAELIGVMTAAGESGLRVLSYGDRAGPDSRGLFQQRDNGAWGTLEERMNPYLSARHFYQALLAVEDWESMDLSRAAHSVQQNSNPNHYAPFEPFAVAVLAALTSEPRTCNQLYMGVRRDLSTPRSASSSRATLPISLLGNAPLRKQDGNVWIR